MRLFIAIDISQEATLHLQEVIDELNRLGLNPTPLQYIHSTLCFIGETPENKLQEITDALSSIKFKPFSVTAKGIGAFPNIVNPNVVWVGFESPELAKLSKTIRDSLAIKPDKPVKLHATLCRVKKPVNLQQLISKHSGEYFADFLVTSFKLKQSVLLPSGAVHSTIATFKSS